MSALPVPARHVDVDLVRGRVVVGTASWRLQAVGAACYRLDDGRTLRLPGFAERTQAVAAAARSTDAPAELRRALRALVLGAAGTAGADDALALAVSGGALEAPGFSRCGGLVGPGEPAIEHSDALAVDLAVIARQPPQPAAWHRLQIAPPSVDELVDEMLQRLLARGDAAADALAMALAVEDVVLPAETPPSWPRGSGVPPRLPPVVPPPARASTTNGTQVEGALRRAWPAAAGSRPVVTAADTGPPAGTPAAWPSHAVVAVPAPSSTRSAAAAAAPSAGAATTHGPARVQQPPAASWNAQPRSPEGRRLPSPAAVPASAALPRLPSTQARAMQAGAAPEAAGATARTPAPAIASAPWRTALATPTAGRAAQASGLRAPGLHATAPRPAMDPAPAALPTCSLHSLARALADECDLRGLAP